VLDPDVSRVVERQDLVAGVYEENRTVVDRVVQTLRFASGAPA
jgi:hypothetical protein